MTTVRTIKEVLKAADIDTADRDFIVECLTAAVNYCQEQYEGSCGDIDYLPSASTIQLKEADKFDLLRAFLESM